VWPKCTDDATAVAVKVAGAVRAVVAHFPGNRSRSSPVKISAILHVPQRPAVLLISVLTCADGRSRGIDQSWDHLAIRG
jgi:hypothetical protein